MCIDVVHLSKYISDICVEKHARLWKKRQNNANDKCFKVADIVHRIFAKLPF